MAFKQPDEKARQPATPAAGPSAAKTGTRSGQAGPGRKGGENAPPV